MKNGELRPSVVHYSAKTYVGMRTPRVIVEAGGLALIPDGARS